VTAPAAASPKLTVEGALAAAFPAVGDPLTWVLVAAIESFPLSSESAAEAASSSGAWLRAAGASGGVLSALAASSALTVPAFAARAALPAAIPALFRDVTDAAGASRAASSQRFTRAHAANADAPEWRLRTPPGASASPRWWLYGVAGSAGSGRRVAARREASSGAALAQPPLLPRGRAAQALAALPASCSGGAGGRVGERLGITVLLDLPPLVGAVFGVGTAEEWGSLLLAPLLGQTGRAADTAALDAFASAWAVCTGLPPETPLGLVRFAAG
jgi:hypothetical protein